MINTPLSKELKNLAKPLKTTNDLRPLADAAAKTDYVMIGEASHGTHEYYEWRAELSKQLIEHAGFRFVAVEGDWPDCYKLNQFVKGYDYVDESAEDVLRTFNRWPTWMWANEEVAEFISWLREFNEGKPDGEKVGFYGLDVYSLWDSLKAIATYLRDNQPDLLDDALRAFACFEPYGPDFTRYAWSYGDCREEVVNLLAATRTSLAEGNDGSDETKLHIEQNARVLKNAEHYYSIMMQSDNESWNVRDRHMFETLERLMGYHGESAKSIVWAHNTHIGDARATSMARTGTINIGQLAREEHEDNVYLVGFSSYRGNVIAGERWGAEQQSMLVPVAKKGSWEDYLHQALEDNGLLIFDGKASDLMHEPLGHRAIGVVYDPDREHGNYVPTVLPERYDAMLYFEFTTSLKPLKVPTHALDEPPETYPSGT